MIEHGFVSGAPSARKNVETPGTGFRPYSAAFYKESRMKFVDPTKLYRKSVGKKASTVKIKIALVVK